MTEQAASSDQPDLLPARMLSEYAYCPRLFHLMHVQGRWADNAFTVEGRNVHSRADKLDHVLPNPDAPAEPSGPASEDATPPESPPEGDEPPIITRSVALGSNTLGLTDKLDLVSTADDQAVPVETKCGRVPNNEQRCWEPERVQPMAQGSVLREHRYRWDHGVLYFAGSRTRGAVPVTPELESRTLGLVVQARQAATDTTLALPLEDSPKCIGRSLAGVCLPDETTALNRADAQTAAVNHHQDQAIILDLDPTDSDVHARLQCLGKAYSPPARATVTWASSGGLIHNPGPPLDCLDK